VSRPAGFPEAPGFRRADNVDRPLPEVLELNWRERAFIRAILLAARGAERLGAFPFHPKVIAQVRSLLVDHSVGAQHASGPPIFEGGERRCAVTRDELTERLAAGPGRVETAARAVSVSGRSTGGWSARENVAHLALVERLVFQARLDQLSASHDVPRWAWTEPGTSPASEVPTLDVAIPALAVARADTIARVRTLDEAGWRRYGLHATLGRLDVAGLLSVIADHDEHHLADLRVLAKRS
jgi:hypothetical protein